MRSRFLLSFRIAPAEIGTLPRRQVAGPSSGQFPRAALDKSGMYSVVRCNHIFFAGGLQIRHAPQGAKHKGFTRV